MAVINITITESSLQIMFGIPKEISITTNIPSTIFYTLDGTTPTILSSVLVGSLDLPTDIPTITLKLFATNGTDSSAIITKVYKPNIVGNRNPHDKVFGLDIPPSKQQDLFPFGENAPNIPVTFGNTGGITVDDPTIVNIPDGFDGTATGTPSNGTDKPLDQYELKYSESNSRGERGPGVGTLPATVNIRVPVQPPQYSEANSKLFNPRAFVIFQDGTEPPEDPDMPLINRQFFNLQNPENTRDGIQFSILVFKA